MNEPTGKMKELWSVARHLNVAKFKKIMAEKGYEVPEDHVALAALHKSRVYLSSIGHMDKNLGRESKRWLEERGIHGHDRRSH